MTANEVEAVLIGTPRRTQHGLHLVAGRLRPTPAPSAATGQAGFTRNLSPTEIFDQARYFAKQLARERTQGHEVVFMGMGEPFANYDPVMTAVALLNDPKGFGLGHRHITISTVGLVDKIDLFRASADAGEPRDLAACGGRRDALVDDAGQP